MTCHIRPCLCCSVTTGTKIASVFIAVGSCFLIVAGVFCLVESQQVAGWWKNAGDYLITKIPNATLYNDEETEETYMKALTYEVVVFGWKILIAGISGMVLAGIIYFGATKFKRHQDYNSSENNLPS